MKWLQRRKAGPPVHPIQVVDDVVEALSAPRAVVYKHSPACWSSVMALRHITAFMTEHPGIPVFMVDVLAQRPLSQDIERRLGIRHESPQAIAIVDGRVVWSGSHFEVTNDKLAAAVVPTT